MSLDVWRRALRAFDKLIDLPGEERARRVAEIAGADSALGAAVESLLIEHDYAERRGGSPIFEVIRALPDVAAPSALPGRGDVIGGRFELGELLGAGGVGSVHHATDKTSGERVAVKLMRPVPGAERPRVRREVAALELLQLPGVVKILDHGVSAGISYIVMEVLDGSPFPGRPLPVSWSALRPIAVRLLEALARVHAAGVVHRDLKPGNVPVDATGAPTILDFGLSWGPALGAALTASGLFMGTPPYIAPEQATGRRVDARADLYSVGCMLYEALSGAPPFVAEGDIQLIRAKLAGPPAPLTSCAPETPRAISELVDELLSIAPEHRPQTAAEVLQRMTAGNDELTRSPDIPRLGDRAALSAVVAAATERRSCDLAGPRGSGRSRLLQDTALEVTSRGGEVIWVLPGAQPFSGLAHLLETDADMAGATLSEIREWLLACLSDRLAKGAVCLVDDAHRIDRWTANVLETARSSGSVIRVVRASGPDSVQLQPLSVEDLHALFRGPDRILHLREDGAQELWKRTGGLPARVVATLETWRRNGLAHWRDGKVALTPESLALLRCRNPRGDAIPVMASPVELSAEDDELLSWITLAWPDATTDVVAAAAGRSVWQVEAVVEALVERGVIHRRPSGGLQPLVSPLALQRWSDGEIAAAHAALAREAPPDGVARLRHLLVTDDAEATARTARRAARDLLAAGRAAEAFPLIEAALDALRDRPEFVEDLIPTLASAALETHGAQTLNRARFRTERLRRSSPTAEQAYRLLAAAASSREGGGAAALRDLDDLGPSDHTELELWRQASRALAARSTPVDGERAVLDDIGRWAREASPRAAESFATWEASFAYRQGRYRETADLLLAAARTSERLASRLIQRANAASALLEDQALEEVEEVASAVLGEARAARHAVIEARAEYYLRAAAYRRGDDLPVDEELVHAVRTLGEPQVDALIHLTEAATAWRRSEEATCVDLARRAERLWRENNFAPGQHLARALVGACVPTELTDAHAFAAEPQTCSATPGIALQIAALAPSTGASGDSFLETVWTACSVDADSAHGSRSQLRHEILSADEWSLKLGTNSRASRCPRDHGQG